MAASKLCVPSINPLGSANCISPMASNPDSPSFNNAHPSELACSVRLKPNVGFATKVATLIGRPALA